MKKIICLALAVAFCGLNECNGMSYAETGQLFAGTAKVSITPETDEPIHDPVFARSLVLQINDQRLAFVAVDLGVFTSENVENVCQEKYGVQKVFICSSHNHTPPSKPGKRPEYADLNHFFETRIEDAVGQALTNMFPARISAGSRTFPQLGFKRLIV